MIVACEIIIGGLMEGLMEKYVESLLLNLRGIMRGD